MAVVHLAELVESRPFGAPGTRVVVKVLRHELAADRGILDRFRREAEIGRLLDHPGLARVLESGSVLADGAEHHYIVLEHFAARSFRQFLDETPRLPEPVLRRIGAGIARALAALHRQGIVHRDLKPENVLITDAHEVKLIDLGVAAASGLSQRALTTHGDFVGSLAYASPEQIDGANLRGGSDLYSLGVILMEAATGSNPFGKGDPSAIIGRHVSWIPPRCRASDETLSPLLDELIASLLSKRAEARPEGATEVAEALEAGEASPWWLRRSAAASVPVEDSGMGWLRQDALPIVGRQPQLQALREHAERALGGAGAAVLLEGEAGIGKSRLVRALGCELQASGSWDVVLVLHEPGASAAGTMPLVQGLATALASRRGACAGASGLSSPEERTALESLLSGDGRAASELPTPRLGSLLGGLLKRASAARPLLLIVEDLHDAASEARQLAGALALHVRRTPVLLLATTRPPEDGRSFKELGLLSRMPTQGLGLSGVKDLLGARLGSATLAERLSRPIADHSEGNPFVALCVVQEMLDEGLLSRAETGRWCFSEEALVRIPKRVSEIAAARLSRLSDQERELLSVASIQGAIFEPELVAECTGRALVEIVQTLALLELRTGLVRSEGRRVRFDHHVTCKVVRDAASEDFRKDVSLGLTGALLSRAMVAPPASRGRLAARAAVHAVAAGRIDMIRPFARDVAGDLALSQRESAADVVLPAMLRDPGIDHAEWLAVARALEISMASRGQAGTARAELVREALSRARGPERAFWINRQAQLLAQAGRSEEAVRLLQSQTAETGDQEGPRLNTLGMALLRGGRVLDALESFEKSRLLAQSAGNLTASSRAAGNIAVCHRNLGEHARAREWFAVQVREAIEAGDAMSLHRARVNLAGQSEREGDYGRYLREARAALETARDSGDPESLAYSLREVAAALVSLGIADETRELVEECAELTGALGLGMVRQSLVPVRAQVQELEGDIAESIRTQEQSLLEHRSNAAGRAPSMGVLEYALCLLRADRRDEGLVHLREVAARAGSGRGEVLARLKLAAMGAGPLPDEGEWNLGAFRGDVLRALWWRAQATGDPGHRALAIEELERTIDTVPVEHRATFLRTSAEAVEIAASGWSASAR